MEKQKMQESHSANALRFGGAARSFWNTCRGPRSFENSSEIRKHARAAMVSVIHVRCMANDTYHAPAPHWGHDRIATPLPPCYLTPLAAHVLP